MQQIYILLEILVLLYNSLVVHEGTKKKKERNKHVKIHKCKQFRSILTSLSIKVPYKLSLFSAIEKLHGVWKTILYKAPAFVQAQ